MTNDTEAVVEEINDALAGDDNDESDDKYMRLQSDKFAQAFDT